MSLIGMTIYPIKNGKHIEKHLATDELIIIPKNKLYLFIPLLNHKNIEISSNIKKGLELRLEKHFDSTNELIKELNKYKIEEKLKPDDK
jgi:hypothetical protein